MENGNNGGGGGGSSMMIVAAMGCCCLLFIGALYWAYSQGWLDDLLGGGTVEEDGGGGGGGETMPESVEPPVEEEEEPAPGGGEPEQPEPEQPEEPKEPEQPGKQPSTGGGKWVCKQPWVRSEVKFDGSNKNPRCCKSGENYDACKAGDVLTQVDDDFDMDALYKKVNQDLKGKVQGELTSGKCWGPVGTKNSTNIGSIIYFERDKEGKGNTVKAWCHPKKSRDGSFKAGEGYALYPACYEDAAKKTKAGSEYRVDRWGSGCFKEFDGEGVGKGDKKQLAWQKSA